ncbi:MAG: hypothetical protein GX638_06980 [Crenarchaeota archaeon]|nr:hypothetical protein [Thermoproteota archaeon]
MYIVITGENITIKRNLKQLNKKLKTNFVKDDFKKYNSNYILNVNGDDIDFKRDANELDRIFVSKLYKKDISHLINYGFFVIMIILMLMNLSSTSSASGMILEIAKAMGLMK